MLTAKVRRFLAKEPAVRRQILRMKIQRIVGNLRSRLPNGYGATFWAFRPDSDWVFSQHGEFRNLLGQWVSGNARNAGDLTRLYAFVLNLKRVLATNVPGDFAELGVYRGNSAAVLAHFAVGRRVFLFDTFSGFDQRNLVGIDGSQPKHFADTSIDRVRSVVGNDAACRYAVGVFPDSLTGEARDTTYSFVSLDCDLYQPMKEGLAFFYPRLSPGGLIFCHDYSSHHWPGATRAVDEFCAAHGITLVLMPDKSGTSVISKPFAGPSSNELVTLLADIRSQ